MASVEHYYTRFDSQHFYHIYNRSVDRKPMFKSADNYEFFLRKYDQYLSPVLDTYAYSLLGNHFHLLVRIKPSQDLTTFQKLSNLNGKTVHDIVSHQFRKFFQSYAMAFNKQQERTGTLFQTPFKRALIDNIHYYKQVVYYIHTNAQKHALIDDFRDWKWSSYNRFLTDRASKLMKQEVISWFADRAAFVDYHLCKPEIDFTRPYFIED